MSIGPLAPRDRRALQRGALIVTVALLYVFGVKPSRERRALLLEQLEAEQAVLARELRVVADTANGRTKRVTTTASSLFTGTDAVIVSASLADYIAAEAEQRDVWLQQATTMQPDRSRTLPSAVEVSVRAEADLQGLLRLLSALERGQMLVQVHALDVRADASEADDGTSPLAITATVRSVAVRPRGAP